MTYVIDKQGRRKPSRGKFTLADGRMVVGDVAALPVEARVAAGLYTVTTGAPGYDDRAGTWAPTPVEPTLAEVQAQAIARIESDVLAATETFAYDGRTFALTPRNVAKWYCLMLVELLGAGTYPVDVTTADHDTYTLATRQAFRAWFAAGFSSVFAAEDAGRKRKKAVISATTTDELEGI